LGTEDHADVKEVIRNLGTRGEKLVLHRRSSIGGERVWRETLREGGSGEQFCADTTDGISEAEEKELKKGKETDIESLAGCQEQDGVSRRPSYDGGRARMVLPESSLAWGSGQLREIQCGVRVG